MSGDQGENSWGLVVAFPDGSPSFVHGFQAGQIWECMTRGDPSMELTCRAENEEVIRRMALAKGYSLTWDALEPADHGWASANLELAPAPSTRDRAEATGFRVIDGGKTPDKDRCFACLAPFNAGDLVLDDASGGTLHAACCGPERESYTDGNGDPLGPDDPIPAGYAWAP